MKTRRISAWRREEIRLTQPRTRPTELGAGSIRIELRHGAITVFHGSAPDLVLARLKSAPPGTWDKLWRALDALGIERVPLPEDV